MMTTNAVPSHKCEILVVDDKEAIRKTFQLMLCREFPDSRIDVAVNGAEAVEQFRVTRHSVILMDLNMPVMDGHSAFSEIEKMCELKNWKMPSVIFCTGYDPPNCVSSLVENNPAHCLLLKPITCDVLYQEIRNRS